MTLYGNYDYCSLFRYCTTQYLLLRLLTRYEKVIVITNNESKLEVAVAYNNVPSHNLNECATENKEIVGQGATLGHFLNASHHV